jgi:hypothetical protein
MEAFAIIYVLAALLIIAARLAWFQTGCVVDLRKANDRAQAEIRALESRLLEVEK